MPALAHDRTAEFRSAVKAQLQGMRQRPTEVAPKTMPQTERSVFFKEASALARDIADTAQMTQRLAKLAKRPPLLDENPQELEELTSIITQKMSSMRNNTDGLEKQLPDMGGAKKDEQVDNLSKNVVKTLRGRLRELTKNFSEVLVERSKIVEASRSRTSQFISAPQRAVPPSSNPLYGNSTPYNPYAPNSAPSSAAYGDDDGELMLPSQEQSMVLLEDQQTSYLSHRSSAVDTIEATINELGQMFGQLSNLLAEQNESVQRIDANTEDISMNVGGAHRELLKFYARVSSNRGLMLKSFGIIIVMFFLWVLLS